MQSQPAVGDSAIKPSLVFRRRAPELVQEGAVDLLDIDAAVVHPLLSRPAALPIVAIRGLSRISVMFTPSILLIGFSIWGSFRGIDQWVVSNNCEGILT